MISLKNILVATDFSEPSDAALTYGRALAEKFDATLTVLNVVDNTVAMGVGMEGYVGNFPELQRELQESAERQLRALVGADESVRMRPITLTSNTPAASIVEHAKTASTDLIVMGTHGRGAVAHLLMGSVAEKVVRTAPCPVLTVRHPEHEFVVPDALVAAKAAEA